MVALGDSVPAGTACDCAPFPDLYADQLAGGKGTKSVNLSVPGATSSDVLAQVQDADTTAALRSASVVLVMIGANDLADLFDPQDDAQPYQDAAADVRTNVTGILRRLRQIDGTSVPIVVLGYWNVVEDGDAAQSDYGTAGVASSKLITGYTNDALRQASAGLAQYVPTMALFDGPDGAADATGLLADDGDHPNARGHEAIADAVHTALPDLSSTK